MKMIGLVVAGMATMAILSGCVVPVGGPAYYGPPRAVVVPAPGYPSYWYPLPAPPAFGFGGWGGHHHYRGPRFQSGRSTYRPTPNLWRRSPGDNRSIWNQ